MKALLAGTLTLALPALAQTGVVGMHPALMLTPGMANPLGMLAPAPFPSFGMGVLPGVGTPLLGGLVYPGLQMAPYLLSRQHLQYMANPYLGGPAADNPYLQSSLPNPFAPPGFAPALPYGGGYGPPASALPFPPALPTASGPMPNPFAWPGPGQRHAPPPATTPAQVMPLPFDPASWFGQFARPPVR